MVGAGRGQTPVPASEGIWDKMAPDPSVPAAAKTDLFRSDVAAPRDVVGGPFYW
jgi:hypothetical protein